MAGWLDHTREGGPSATHGGGLYRALIVSNPEYEKDPHNLWELKGPKVDGLMLRQALTEGPTALFNARNITLRLIQRSCSTADRCSSRRVLQDR